ncbi:globin domain-containing protein [Williamsia sp.]|uniref:globin domain-containing protein n=1 Tax=Williamsia sp. TaxID=1872085 RepID=UPI002F955D6D
MTTAPLPDQLTATPTGDLEPHHAEMIAATLPLVGANIDAITTEFYRRLFADHPELLRNLFNRGNQAQGAQQRALAASIATFATHLIDPELEHPAVLVGRIGHKHASLGVTADQYPIVHTHLFAAIVEVLGAETVTPDVAAAWDRVYWLMAETLIDLERRLYADAGVGAGDVFRRARVVGRTDDPSGTVAVTVVATSESFPDFVPGQYISVGVTLPDGARQIRQYSLINTPGRGELTFAVRPVAATTDGPAGEVSTHIGERVSVGDLLDVSIPFGDLPVGSIGSRPLVLISAGIGITPMIGILEHLAIHAPGCPVQVLHADRSVRSHPLRARQQELMAQLPGGSLDLWYEETGDAADTGVHGGQLQMAGIPLDDSADVYLCGNNGFVQSVRNQLLDRGVAPERLHSELFSPDDWLLA